MTYRKILEEQAKLHGKTKRAVKEAIRICKDANVLKEYLESRESEVVNIMMQLYDQEEVMRVYISNERRDSGIMNVVRALKDIGLSFAEVVEKIAGQFNMTYERAEKEVEGYWK